jgi:hypothetical protein
MDDDDDDNDEWPRGMALWGGCNGGGTGDEVGVRRRRRTATARGGDRGDDGRQ